MTFLSYLLTFMAGCCFGGILVGIFAGAEIEAKVEARLKQLLGDSDEAGA